MTRTTGLLADGFPGIRIDIGSHKWKAERPEVQGCKMKCEINSAVSSRHVAHFSVYVNAGFLNTALLNCLRIFDAVAFTEVKAR